MITSPLFAFSCLVEIPNNNKTTESSNVLAKRGIVLDSSFIRSIDIKLLPARFQQYDKGKDVLSASSIARSIMEDAWQLPFPRLVLLAILKTFTDIAHHSKRLLCILYLLYALSIALQSSRGKPFVPSNRSSAFIDGLESHVTE